MQIEVDSKLRCQVKDEGAKPLVFMPDVDWGTFREPNIIHAY
jgi:hypothetical protein